MQDPNADTEWNDVLRAKGIIPQKEKEVTEEDVIGMIENAIEKKSQGKGYDEMSRDELDEIEDDIDEDEERIFEEYRRKRLAEMKEAQQNAKYGDVGQISKADYVKEVNQAGEGIWVVLHVYKESIPLCKLINKHITDLARKFPETKFLKSISSVCIPNYPDKNLPTVFVYFEGDLKKQYVGPMEFGVGMNLTLEDLEWKLHQSGAVKSEMTEAPRPKVQDVMSSALQQDSDSDNDW